MGKTSTCQDCKLNLGTLTKEKLCASCYRKKFGKWSEEFQKSKDERKRDGH